MSVRLSDDEARTLDAHRGSLERGAFLRWVLIRHLSSSKPLPDPRAHVDSLRAQRQRGT